MLNKKPALFLVFLLIFSLLLTGCSFGDKTTDTSEKMVRAAWPHITPEYFDFVNSDQTGTYYVYGLIGDPLIRYDDNVMQFVPAIASDWTVEENNTVFTFEIRDDVYFHNGNRLTVEDVEFTFEKHLDPENPSGSAERLMLIEGAQEKMMGETDKVFGIEVIDDNKIQFTLTGPRADFLGIMAMSVHSILDKDELLERGGAIVATSDEPFTGVTGPFKICSHGSVTPEEKEEKERLFFEFIKNENYFDNKANIDRLIVEDFPGREVVVNKFLDGYYDIVLLADNIPDLEQYATPMSLGAVNILKFNVQKELWQDENIRKAFRYAINEDSLVEITNNKKQKGLLPNILPGVEPIEEDVYDLELAKEYLEEAGYPKGEGLPVIKLIYLGGNPLQLKQLELVENQLNDLGIEINVVQLAGLDELKERLPNADIIKLGVGANYYDAMSLLDYTLLKNAPHNYFGMEHDKIERLIQASREETNQYTRFAIHNEINQIVHDEALIIPVDNMIVYLFESDRLKSVRHDYLGDINYENIDIR